MAGAAAGDDSGGHGYGEPAHGEGGELIKVGGRSSLKLGFAGVGVGKPAEAVDD